MRSRFPDESGAVTAEFAAAIPAVVLVLACALGGIGLASEQLRLEGAAFDAARLIGRGDAGGLARVQSVDREATMTTRTTGALICVHVSARGALGAVPGIVLTASACALDDARP